MFQNIPHSPNRQNTPLIQNSFSQGTQNNSQARITPIISAQNSTPIKDRLKIFSQTHSSLNGSQHNIQRYQTQSMSIPSSTVNVTQKPQIVGNFFMSPNPSENRLASQDSIRTIQQSISANYSQKINTNSPYLLSSQAISKINTSEHQNFNNTNSKEQDKQSLIQSVAFQPSTHHTNDYQIPLSSNNKESLSEISQKYPFKSTQESKFEVFEDNNIDLQSVQESNLHTTKQQQQVEEEKFKNLVSSIISEHKKSFEENILQNAENIKSETAANNKIFQKINFVKYLQQLRQLNEIKDSIEQSKNDVIGRLNQTFQERYEKLQEDSNKVKINLQDIVESIKVKVEQEYLVQLGKSMNEQISKLIKSKWEEAELGVQQQIQGLQKFLNGFDNKHNQAFMECGDYLTQLKTEIEKVFFDGQNYFKVNLDAIGQNLSDKINTADVKSVFVQMNEGFYDQLQNKLDSLKVRTDSMSGTLKSMQDDQSKKLEQLENDLNQYFVSHQNGIEKLEKSQQKLEQNILGFQNSCQLMQQYKNKVDTIENVVRNQVSTQHNGQLNSETSIQTKFDKLVEALTKIQANFVQLKQKYDTESQEWKKYINQNNTLNDSKQSMGNPSTQSIASLNSQIIQLQNLNKSLSDTIRSKESMIQDQKILIESFEKKIATQQNQLTNLVKELKQIKQESKHRQNTNNDLNSSMLSSIQSIRSSGINQSLADSLHNDFLNNVQVFTSSQKTQPSNKQATCDFNDLDDYQQDLENEYQNEKYLRENKRNIQEIASPEKDISEYFRKLKTEGSALQNSHKVGNQEPDFFFYPNGEEKMNQIIQDQRPLSTKNYETEKLNSKQSMFLATQPSSMFVKKTSNEIQQSLQPKSTIPKKGSTNTEPNIENNVPPFNSSISNKSLSQSPFQIELSQQKQQPLQNIKPEMYQNTNNNQLTKTYSINNNLLSNQVNCFSQPLKNKTHSENTLPQQSIISTQNSQDQSQSITSQTNTNTSSNSDSISHLIKRRLLYNNTLKEKKETKLKVRLEDNNRLKDEFGKFIYDKNGQAIFFTNLQLDYLLQEIQIIELI